MTKQFVCVQRTLHSKREVPNQRSFLLLSSTLICTRNIILTSKCMLRVGKGIGLM